MAMLDKMAEGMVGNHQARLNSKYKKDLVSSVALNAVKTID